MGSNTSVIPPEDLDDYAALTYLTKKEILHAWERWTELVNDSSENALRRRYTDKYVHNLPELKHNPFKKRLTYVFSSQEDGKFSFEDFLDLLSVLSENAPISLKSHYAFRIYDYDEDNIISSDDLKIVLDLLTTENEESESMKKSNKFLSEKEKDSIIEKVLKETDLNGDGISTEEFRHLMTKCPDFATSFKFSI